MVQIAQKMKRVDFYKSLLGLEINQRVGVDLPGEVAGISQTRTRISG
jgi:cell division protein FtsI (penicillin-binding protein 3)